MVNHLPLNGDVWGVNYFIEGQPLPRPGEVPSGVYRVSRPGYFGTMQIPILNGRDFERQDTADAPAVAIVNDKFARTYWPGGSPLGKRITFDDPRKNPAWITVIGVVKDVKQQSWTAKPESEVYLPFRQVKTYLENTHPWAAYMTLVMRTSGDPLNLAKAVQNVVWSIDKNLPVSHLQTLEQVIAGSTWQARFNLLLIGLFAALALGLAALGIYGVMAYSVTERTHELGIRMALGAKQSDVLRLVVSQGMALAAIGGAIGIAGAFAVTRVLTGLLYEVKATDPAIFLGVPCVFAVIAFLATYFPARRATKVDPMLALRWE
jgi:putative ABC transport system permease protein